MERHEHRWSWLVSKTVRYAIVFWVIITLNFLLPRLMPGDPVKNMLGEQAFYTSPEALDTLRAQLGLDAPCTCSISAIWAASSPVTGASLISICSRCCLPQPCTCVGRCV